MKLKVEQPSLVTLFFLRSSPTLKGQVRIDIKHEMCYVFTSDKGTHSRRIVPEGNYLQLKDCGLVVNVVIMKN